MADVPASRELSRIRWQCRRGMLELDALLADFVDVHYHDLDPAELAVFKDVLTYPDQLLFDYFFGNSQPTDKDVSHVIERIRNTHTP